MPTKWQVGNSVLENYWVEVDAISKSKIRQRIWKRDCLLPQMPFLASLTPSSFLGSHPRPENQLGTTTSDTKNPRQTATSCLIVSAYSVPRLAKPHPIYLRRVKIHLIFFCNNDLQCLAIPNGIPNACLQSLSLIGEKAFEEFIRWDNRNVWETFYMIISSEAQTNQTLIWSPMVSQMAQLVKCPTPCFCSDQSLRVVRSSALSGLWSVWSLDLLSSFLSLPLSPHWLLSPPPPPSTLAHFVSLKWINTYLKKKKVWLSENQLPLPFSPCV